MDNIQNVYCILSIQMLPLFIIHRNIDTKALFTCKTNIRHEGLAKTQTSLLQLASLHLYVKG